MQQDSSIATSAVTLPASDPLRGTGGFLWTFRVCVYGGLAVAFYLGGPVVRVGALAAAFFALFADRAGAIRHALHLLSLPLLFILARRAGLPLGDWLAPRFNLTVPLALAIGVATVIVAGLLVTTIVGRLLTRRLRRHRYLYVLNRVGGSLLGVGEGALVAAVLVWILTIFGPALFLHAEALANAYPHLSTVVHEVDALRCAFGDDPAGRWLREANPLRKVPAVMTVAALGELSAEPGVFWRLVEEGELQTWLEEPVIREHFEQIKADPEVRWAVEHRDLETLVRSRHLTLALADDKLCREIAWRWPALRARLARDDIERARRLAGRLDGVAKRRYEQAVRRAEEFGVELP